MSLKIISAEAYCIIAVVQKLDPLRENIREYVYLCRLPDVTSKIRARSSYEGKLREELEFTSSQTLGGYHQYRACFQALWGRNQYSLLLEDPDTLFKWLVFCSRDLYVFIREGENGLGKNTQNECKWSTSKFMKTTYFSSLFLVITSGSSKVSIFRIPSSLSNTCTNFVQKAGKRFVCTSDADTSQICQFKMPARRPVGSAASCIQ